MTGKHKDLDKELMECHPDNGCKWVDGGTCLNCPFQDGKIVVTFTAKCIEDYEHQGSNSVAAEIRRSLISSFLEKRVGVPILRKIFNMTSNHFSKDMGRYHNESQSSKEN